MTTRERVLDAALSSFGGTGYDATSLDQLAGDLGIRKQTILYYYPSKAELLDAVIDASSAELAATLEAALADAGPGWDRVEAIIRGRGAAGRRYRADAAVHGDPTTRAVALPPLGAGRRRGHIGMRSGPVCRAPRRGRLSG
jgi:AcrR family transcriptional regulator